MPRDPNRIPEILDAIGRTWRKYPDLRLGQLLLNAMNDEADLYYVEDDRLAQKVTSYGS